MTISFPNAAIRILNQDGTVSLPWRIFFQNLYNSVGGEGGSTDLTPVYEAIAAAAAKAALAKANSDSAIVLSTEAQETAEQAIVFSNLAFGDTAGSEGADGLGFTPLQCDTSYATNNPAYIGTTITQNITSDLATSAFAVGNFINMVDKIGASTFYYYGRIAAITGNTFYIDILGYGGVPILGDSASWDIILTGKTPELPDISQSFINTTTATFGNAVATFNGPIISNTSVTRLVFTTFARWEGNANKAMMYQPWDMYYTPATSSYVGGPTNAYYSTLSEPSTYANGTTFSIFTPGSETFASTSVPVTISFNPINATETQVVFTAQVDPYDCVVTNPDPFTYTQTPSTGQMTFNVDMQLIGNKF